MKLSLPKVHGGGLPRLAELKNLTTSMDTRESNLAWIIAGVLLVLLIVVGYMWYSSRDLDNVLQEGREDIGYYRDEIERHCSGPEMDQEQCAEDMEELSDLLREFSADIDASSTTTLDANN